MISDKVVDDLGGASAFKEVPTAVAIEVEPEIPEIPPDPTEFQKCLNEWGEGCGNCKTSCFEGCGSCGKSFCEGVSKSKNWQKFFATIGFLCMVGIYIVGFIALGTIRYGENDNQELKHWAEVCGWTGLVFGLCGLIPCGLTPVELPREREGELQPDLILWTIFGIIAFGFGIWGVTIEHNPVTITYLSLSIGQIFTLL